MPQAMGGNSVSAHSELSFLLEKNKKELEQLRASAAQWESYRSEMQNMEERFAKLARNFLDLRSYEDAAKCATKAEGMRFVLGRMPPSAI